VAFDSVALDGGVPGSQVGACCNWDGTCTEGVIEADCQPPDGIWQGPNTTCAETSCCPYPFADGDHDRDVDQADFGLWQACYDGGNGLIAGCECFDRDGDNDVDGADFIEFANCFTGAEVPWSQGLTPSCNP